MNVLFLTVVRINDIEERGIYTDLLRQFRDKGHQVFVVYPTERRYGKDTRLMKTDGITILRVKSLNIQKTNIVEKGIATILLERTILGAVKKKFSSVKFDLVLYSTPPITFTRAVEYVKQRDGAVSYLLLKDIFPQNAVDLGMLRRGGFLHSYFRKKEEQLYRVSDYIGCMSPANVAYILRNNAFVKEQTVEVCPNAIEPASVFVSAEEKKNIRKKFSIPENVTVCVYGGNLGKPQGVDFLLNVLESNRNNTEVFFLIIGSGTEFEKLKNWINRSHSGNTLLISQIPKNEYDLLLQSCDIGLLFLDRKFTIPNFPSRLLPYLEYSLPVLTATDPNTDIGSLAESGGFGFAAISGDIEHFNANLQVLIGNPDKRTAMGEAGRQYLENHYDVTHAYNIIMNHFH